MFPDLFHFPDLIFPKQPASSGRNLPYSPWAISFTSSSLCPGFTWSSASSLVDMILPLDEPYLPEPMEGSYGPYTVPEGCYFMMGDNRNNSLDARFWKNQFVEKDKIIAKVLFTYFPKIEKVE